MLRSPHPLLPALALLASCTAPSFDPGDVIAGSSSSSSTHDTAASTTSPVLDDAPDPPTTTDATTSTTTTTTTTDPGTTLADTTDDTTDDTTGAPLRCGDGIVDPGESCEELVGNSADAGSSMQLMPSQSVSVLSLTRIFARLLELPHPSVA